MTPNELDQLEKLCRDAINGPAPVNDAEDCLLVAARQVVALIAELRVTRRALVMATEGRHSSAGLAAYDYWISEARKELETE